ncbi:MAG: hypothetical protein HRT58_12020 [Crocinitomicaceae bacterium]|nr:hypothetical protein [Flavobacteriales bacterium]NQZ36387.1 hypothetical protein [Crocinitomicaceae bacterium]
MTITKTTVLLNTLLSKADSKREKKVYACFIRTLTSLEKRDLTESQSQLIQEKLSSLNLTTATGNNKKYYGQKLAQFVAFLKTEFHFTKANYYTELGMIYGMSVGTGIGISFGVAISPSLGISIGLSIGTAIGLSIGMMLGARKDAEAKKLGKVI